MNSRSLLLCALALVVLPAAAPSASAAATNVLVATRNPNAKTPTAKATAAAPAALAPQSTFVIPRQAAEGRDPFFPNSTRPYGSALTAKSTTAPAPTVEVTLRGISGTAEAPLAIINTTTFAAGESSEVTTKNGRTRVQCLEINMNAGTVLVQIGGERRVLRLTATP